MRVSVLTDDPGFVASKAERRSYRITLDGEVQRKVVTADEEDGVVVRYALNEKGLIIREGNTAKRESLRGRVVISRSSDQSRAGV